MVGRQEDNTAWDASILHALVQADACVCQQHLHHQPTKPLRWLTLGAVAKLLDPALAVVVLAPPAVVAPAVSAHAPGLALHVQKGVRGKAIT